MNFCLIFNSGIILGPTYWGDLSIRQALFNAGFCESAAGIHAPDGTPLPPLPATEPTTALTLADGYAIFPVVVQPDSPPAGEIVTGHTTTVEAGVVTVAPVYGPAPVAPTLTVIQAQSQVCLAITNQRDQLLYGTYTDSSSNTWQVDEKSRALMTGAEAKLGTGMAIPSGFAWITSTNVPVPMTAESFKALTQDIFNWTENMFATCLAKKAAVMALTDSASVLAYCVTTGWPTT